MIAVGFESVPAIIVGLVVYLLTGAFVHPISSSSLLVWSIMVNKLVHMEQVRAVASRNDMFASKLYSEVAKGEGNFVISPSSVSGVMAMVRLVEFCTYICHFSTGEFWVPRSYFE